MEKICIKKLVWLIVKTQQKKKKKFYSKTDLVL